MFVLFLNLGDAVNHVEHASDLYVIFTYCVHWNVLSDISLNISIVCIFSRWILCMKKFIKTNVLLYNSASDSTHTFNEGLVVRKMSQHECISSSQVMRNKTITKTKKRFACLIFSSYSCKLLDVKHQILIVCILEQEKTWRASMTDARLSQMSQ